MPRSQPKIAPMISRRETFQLLLLVTGLILVVQTMARLNQPGAMNWFFDESVETALADVPEERAVLDDGPDDGFARVQADAPDEPDDPIQEFLGDFEAPQPDEAPEQVNPLGLELIEELQAVNPAYLADVKDEFDPYRRRVAKQAQIREYRAKANDSIYQILGVAATTPPERLAAKSRRDVFLSNLWKDPDTYRGRPIRVEGIIRQIETVAEELDEKNPYGIDKIYEAWVFVEDLQAHVRVWFTALPEGVEPSLAMKENVIFDAYFLKLYTYKARDDKWHAVPMLLAFKPTIQQIEPGMWDRQAKIFSAIIGAAVLLGMILYVWIARRDRIEAKRLREATQPNVAPSEGLSFLDGRGQDGADEGDDPYSS